MSEIDWSRLRSLTAREVMPPSSATDSSFGTNPEAIDAIAIPTGAASPYLAIA